MKQFRVIIDVELEAEDTVSAANVLAQRIKEGKQTEARVIPYDDDGLEECDDYVYINFDPQCCDTLNKPIQRIDITMNDANTNVREEDGILMPSKDTWKSLFDWLGEDGVKELEDAGVVEVTVVDGKTYVNPSF